MEQVSTKRHIDPEVYREQKNLAVNAWHLARYLMEHDHQFEIPKQINIGRFLVLAENYPELGNEEKIQFFNDYDALEKVAKNVTARTLVATRIHGRGFFAAAFDTSVGKYLLFLALMTMGFVVMLILSYNHIPIWNGHALHKSFSPFFAAGLGTCVFLLRVTQEKLTMREFDPAFVPSHLIRLLLGSLIGGSIVVLFPEMLQSIAGGLSDQNASGGAASSTGDSGTVSGSNAVAFILGYAIEIFYTFLDKIGGRIKD